MRRILLTGPIFFLAFACAGAATIAQWNFNSPVPDGTVSTGTNAPSAGSGTATLVGGATATFVTGDTTHDPAGSSDNSGWNTTHYPAATAANKSAGVRFDLSTTGYTNITLNWYQQNSPSASRYLRFQYTLDGSTFIDGDVIAVYGSGVFTNQSVNLSGIAGAGNNSAFGFRLVAEFESSATGSGASAYVPTDGTSYATTGTIRYDMVTISGTPPDDGNTPPYIFSSIGGQTLRPAQSTGPLAFTILDAESPASSLSLTAGSSSPAVIPAANVSFGGSGANRTVSVTAGNQPGSSIITVYVADPGGKSNSTSFAVTVLPSNTAPFISPIPRTNTLVNIPAPTLAFTIGDAETPATSLTVSGSCANSTLVPNNPANISFGGSGTNRTITITPASGQTGVAPITVTVSDGTNTASTVFPVMVTPSAAVIFYEPFTYADGSVITNSAFLWATRSGTDGECQAKSQQLQVTATQTEDVVGALIGGPYNVTNHTALYAAFKVNFLTLPKAAPGLFAHFANGSTLRGRVYAGTTNAAPGFFQLQTANGSDTWTNLATDLQTNRTYAVVTRYDVDAAITTLWLNPASEASPGVTASDPQTASRIASYGFRQDTDMGATMLVDDLKVGLSFAAVTSTNALSPIPLSVERSGGNVVLRWSNPVFLLQATPALSVTYTNVTGATSPFTNPVFGKARFFRLRASGP